MNEYICNKTERKAYSLSEKQTGIISTFTHIRLKGDYRSGPIPVEVSHEIRFTPDEKYWPKDSKCPDESYPYSIEKIFTTTDERAAYIKNLYKEIEEVPAMASTVPLTRGGSTSG
jgi:hypothetical protein